MVQAATQFTDPAYALTVASLPMITSLALSPSRTCLPSYTALPHLELLCGGIRDYTYGLIRASQPSSPPTPQRKTKAVRCGSWQRSSPQNR